MRIPAGFAVNVLTVVVGAVLTGIVLDEAGQGKFGQTIKMLAQKTTRGFGV